VHHRSELACREHDVFLHRPGRPGMRAGPVVCAVRR
jgi:hypothetical protein